MNVIVVSIDSLRTDHLACYGNSWIHTPNIDKFFKKSIIFDGFKMNANPTIPFRRGMMLGRKIFPYKDAVYIPGVTAVLGWQPMGHDEVTIQQVLQSSGYVTGMITDVWHFFKPAYNFHRGFDSWQFVRGHEGDPYMTGDSGGDPDQYVNKALAKSKMRNFLDQYVRNAGERHCEEDYFSPQLFRTAAKWLERNAGFYKDFYLYIDSFDPHEPWDPPKHYVDLYDPGYEGREVIFPMNGLNEDLTPAEIKHIRALYAGKVTMVDRWFGHFMETFERMGLGEDTAVLFLSDHGVGLGEHGLFKKTPGILYPELLDMPMMLMMPEAHREHKRIKGFVHECDIAPTLLKRLGLDLPDTMDGLDFWPLVTGEKDSLRDYVVGAYHNHAYVRDHKYHYFRSLQEGGPGPLLFDLEKDPRMNQDIATDKPDVVKTMEERLIRELDGWTLPEQIGQSAAAMPYEPLGRRR